jgi:hypothetical protein
MLGERAGSGQGAARLVGKLDIATLKNAHARESQRAAGIAFTGSENGYFHESAAGMVRAWR